MISDKVFFLNNVLKNGIKEMVFIIKVDKQNNFYYEFLNHAAIERTFLTEEVIGKSIHDFYLGDTADFLTEKYMEVINTQAGLTYEDTYDSPVGKKHSETTLTPLNEEEGMYIIAVVKDITQRKHAEIEMQKSKDALFINKQKYRSLYDYNLDAIVTINLNGSILTGNDAVKAVFGYDAVELKNSSIIELISKEDTNRAKISFEKSLNGRPKDIQSTIVHKTGDKIEVIMKFTPIIVNKKIVGIYGIFKDISEKVELGKKYKESEDLSRIIAQNTNDLITIINRHYEIIYVSPSYRDTLAYDHNEYISKSFLHNVHNDDHDRLKETFLESIQNHTPWKEQFRQQHGDGNWIWSELRASPVYDDQNDFTHMVVVSRNITTRKDYELKLRHMAYHDSLTGLPNRRLFMEQLTQHLQEVDEKENRLAIIMMDLDQFKKINDRLGHDTGDKVIQEFGKRINGLIREGDMMARLGGDEFIVLLPNIPTSQYVGHVAARILEKMNETWCLGEQELEITTSMGVVISSSLTPETPNEMFKYADKALYKAKAAGGNDYIINDLMNEA